MTELFALATKRTHIGATRYREGSRQRKEFWTEKSPGRVARGLSHGV
jgi:hypothetical protein